jgi:AhpD family alkylhydroperoxidase
MSNRVNIAQAEPEAYKALMGIERYMNSTKLSHTHKELIKIRASQINGCAFCLDMHTKDARKYGETERRIYTLSAWRETDFFSEEEQCLLTMTEEITLISQAGLSDKTYEWAAKLFDETTIAQVIMAIIAINAWNRLAIATRLHPPLEVAEAN